MDELYAAQESATPRGDSLLHPHMAFLAENPEAFGFISDAFPVVTDECLIAAGGYEAEAGVASFTYPAVGGPAGLCDTVFAGILPADDALTHDILAASFGREPGYREHPVARYAAVLAEAVAARCLSGTMAHAAFDEIARALGERLPVALAALRENLCLDGMTARDAELYEVSLAVCRLRDLGEGNYALDLFAAGDYRVYLLDASGLRPLRLPTASVISPEGERLPLTGRQVRLRHPSPFAILLLSGSACAVNAAEAQGLKENPGLAWRYRMRLEAHILRIMTALSRETDFGERAGQFFTGRANGRNCASGAMAIRCKSTPFSAFHADCLARLRHLEDIIALLPDGYDPNRVPTLPSRVETETNYIRRLIAQEQGLPERITDALRALALEKLYVEPGDPVPLPEDVPDLRRLTRRDVAEIYRTYDAENDEDYAAIRRNRAMMREQLSEHWVTLRPILLRVGHQLAAEAESLSAAMGDGSDDCDRAYAALLRLNARLGGLWEERKAYMDTVAVQLARHSAILQSNGEDWLHGRAGIDHAAGWADTAAAELAGSLRELANTYDRTEAEYRSLLCAYMAERDQLFSRDAEREGGVFADAWRALSEGRMPEEHMEIYRAAMAAETEGDRYVTLWEGLCLISRGTGARLVRIRDRAADRRMARDVAMRMEFRIAALRASAYRDADWGEAVCELLDAPHRNSYFTMVRRWQETCELMARQATAYEEYRTLYEDIQ